MTRARALRYGENPHQKAAFYALDGAAGPSLARAEVLQGKELSYNNLLDLDAALGLCAEFAAPAAVIVKHTNPCGVAIADLRAWRRPTAARARPTRCRRSAASSRSTGRSTASWPASSGRDLPRVRGRAGVRAPTRCDPGGEARTCACWSPTSSPDAPASLELRSVTGGFLVQTIDRDTAAAVGRARW